MAAKATERTYGALAPKSSVLDVVVVGAGIAGLYSLYKVRSEGFTSLLFEAGSDVGGTWFWNRYPGCRCDVESVEYSYSFSEELQQSWTWSEKYASQPEIQRYLAHVAERFDLYRDIRLNTRVTSAVFDEAAKVWRITTDAGDQFAARTMIMATGPLSVPITPQLPELESFKGRVLYTNQWPTERVDFTGKRVGVVGTGSSGIQAIPEIAAEAAEVVVFQRTANYSIPARNEPLAPAYVADVKARYPQMRVAARASYFGTSWAATETSQVSALELSGAEQRQTLEHRWEKGGTSFLITFKDLLTDLDANKVGADFVRAKIKATVRDPQKAEILSPTPEQPLGCKQICADTNYFETFNQDHVSIVDLRKTPIEQVTSTGVKTAAATFEFDYLVLATGFDAMTGALLNMDIQGRGSRTLRDHWKNGATTQLGVSVSNFPNMFIVNGPGSPSVFANMVFTSEQTVEWVTRMLIHARKNGFDTIDAEAPAEAKWVEHVNAVGSGTLFNGGCNSWYIGANVPGKARVFLPYAAGLDTYTRICEENAAAGYPGFKFG